MFSLHPTLASDTSHIADLTLSCVLIMKDKGFPWLILVPKREGVREIHELTPDDRALLIEEVSLASTLLTRLFTPVKINIGALGNIVPQLHVHVIARFENDRAWPGPVWGSGPKELYSEAELASIVSRLREAFNRA
ncbi:MAG: HIT family protein [Deltaproteobacteria bacterium]|nr:HIT family protein [Deltaproteobacteria bacterium]